MAYIRLIFADPAHVDSTFTKLATSLISGSLHDTPATSIKVMLKPEAETTGGNPGQTINIHFPDAYSADDARTVRAACQKGTPN